MPGLETLIPPPVVAIITGIGMWKAAQILPQYSLRALLSAQSAASVLPYTPYVAGALAVVGLGTAVVAFGAFRAHKTTTTPLAPSRASSLVTDGIYAITRNPMYVGLVTVLTGWSVYLQSPLVGAFEIAGFIAYITQFQIKPEERALTKIFQGEYTAYCARVRRWL